MYQTEQIRLSERYGIVELQEEDSVNTFNCGDDDLNDFIINKSSAYRKELLAVSYIVVSKNQKDDIVAYFSLANDSLSISDFANKTEFNRFRRRHFMNEKRLKNYPAARICRLAVSSINKGQRLGTFLLNFIKSYFLKINKTGCRFLTVDAYAAAVPFYLKNGFLPLTPDDENSRTRSLYFDLNDIAD